MKTPITRVCIGNYFRCANWHSLRSFYANLLHSKNSNDTGVKYQGASGINMFRLLAFLGLAFVTTISFAGDFASGQIEYKADFSSPFSMYKMTPADNEWTASLVGKFKYSGKVVRFVKTDIKLTKNGKELVSSVFRAIEFPDRFYVLSGDVMLSMEKKRIYSPGTGGFSMHAPRSKNFIVCLNCDTGGVPFSSHSKVGYRNMWWFATEFERL